MPGRSAVSQNAQKFRIGGPGAAHVEVLNAEVWALHIVEPNSSPQGQALNRSVRNGAAKPSVLQQLLAREALPVLQADQVPSTASTVRKVPFCTLPPAPINRSPGQTLMVCGAFVGTAPRASYGTTKASAGASLRFSRSLICNRFAWEMTRLTSGSPRLGKRRRASRTAAGNGTCSGSSTLSQVRELEDPLVEAPALRELVAPAPPRELAAAWRVPRGDPDLLRVAQRAHVLRGRQGPAAGLLPASREGGEGRRLYLLEWPCIFLQKRPGRGRLRRVRAAAALPTAQAGQPRAGVQGVAVVGWRDQIGVLLH